MKITCCLKAVTLVANTDESFASLVTRLEYLSDYHRAKRAVALCLLYINKLKERVKSEKPTCLEKLSPKMIQTRSKSQVEGMKEATSKSQSIMPITVETMDHAEMVMVRAAQAIHFDDESKVLTLVSRESASSKNYAIKKSSPLNTLDPFMDSNGLLRVGGRLKDAEMPDHVKFPVILPGKSHIASLIVKHYHEHVRHQGRGMTINEVRSRGYWIVGGCRWLYGCLIHLKVCHVSKAQRYG